MVLEELVIRTQNNESDQYLEFIVKMGVALTYSPQGGAPPISDPEPDIEGISDTVRRAPGLRWLETWRKQLGKKQKTRVHFPERSPDSG